MKITWPYLRKAALWSLSIMAAVAAMLAVMWAIMSAILWIADGKGPLHWILLAVALFVLLVLWRVGTDLAVEIITKPKGPGREN